MKLFAESNFWSDFWKKVSDFFLKPDSSNLNYLTRILIAIGIIIVGWLLIKLIGILIKKTMGLYKKGPNIDRSAKFFIVSIIKALLWVGVAFIVISVLKIDVAGFAGVASAITVALGLALQDLIGCMFSGILLLQQKIILTGEYIMVKNAFGQCEGSVDKVHLFFTYLKTPQGQIVIIPNSNMTKATITNFSRSGKRRIDYDVGIHYNSDIALAKKVFNDIILADERVLKDESYTVYVAELSSYSIIVRIRCWTTFDDYWPVYNELGEKVLLTCRDNGIIIPSSTEIKVSQ